MPIRWHPVLKPLRERVKEGGKRATELKRVHDWEEKHPGRHYPREGLNFWGSWRHFADKGQLSVETHKRCALRVSVPHSDRALRVLNLVAHLAVEKGLAVELTKEGERLELKQGETSIELRVAERFDVQQRKELRSWSKTWEVVKVHAPTGRLSLFVEGPSFAQTVLTDKPKELLEGRTDEIWAVIQQRLAATAAKDREWAEWHRQQEEEDRKRQEQERAEQERRRAEAEEKRRRDALFEEAAAWQRTSKLRTYLAELDKRAATGGGHGDGFAIWRSWAGRVLAEAEQQERVQRGPLKEV